MVRAAVVTTTINVPSNLIEWAKTMSTEDVIIVSGDTKTPHKDVNDLMDHIKNTYGIRSYYLEPDLQKHWASSKALPWNCIQRRNIAFLEAAMGKPEFIVTVDDDNFPLSTNQIDDYEYLLSTTLTDEPTVKKSSGWYNIGEKYSPRVVHRGFPLQHRHQSPSYTPLMQEKVNIGVATSLWLGDPDIDAIERIANDPKVGEPTSRSTILETNTWCPFNSQATAFKTALLPLYMMWPRVGRFDDIWPSYVVRTVLDQIGYNVHYGLPLVSQMRNEHDLVKDLTQELHGYKHTLELANWLRDFIIPTPVSGVYDMAAIARMIYKELTVLPWMHASLFPVFEAWLDDMERLAAFPQSVNFTINTKKD